MMRITAIAFLVIATIAGSLAINPPVARAQFTVIDPALIFETTVGVIPALEGDLFTNIETTLATTLSKIQQYFEFEQTFVRAALKKEIIDYLSDQVVGYVNGGDSGNPKFVTDWQALLGDARTTGAQNFSQSLSASDICQNFRKPLLDTLGASGNTGGSDAIDALKCDFTGPQLASAKQDPSSGGWDMYRNLYLKPQNNYLSALVIARQQKRSAINEAEKAAQNEGLAGLGFLSAKSNGKISTPGSLIKDLTARVAAADIDLVVNAEQLTDLIGAMGSSLISKISSPSDSGLSGVDVAARRRARNGQLDDNGSRTKKTPQDCANEFIPDGDIAAAQADPESNYSIYAACVENTKANNSQSLLARLTTLLEQRNNLRRSFIFRKDKLQSQIRRLKEILAIPNRNCRMDTDPTTGEFVYPEAEFPYQRPYRKNGVTKYRLCTTQNRIDTLSKIELTAVNVLRIENLTALGELRSLQLSIQAVTDKDPDREAKMKTFTDQFEYRDPSTGEIISPMPYPQSFSADRVRDLSDVTNGSVFAAYLVLYDDPACVADPTLEYCPAASSANPDLTPADPVLTDDPSLDSDADDGS